MTMHRRDLLKRGAALSFSAALPSAARAQGAFAPRPGAWRNFEIVTRLEIAPAGRDAQAWIPVPAINEPDWFKSLGSQWRTNGKAALARDPKYGAEMVHVQWTGGETATVEVTSRIATRDRGIDLAKAGTPAPLSAADRKLYTAGSELIPIDGIVKATSDRITAGAQTDVDKARAIYEWMVANTFRDPQARGCGTGDIAAMLRSGRLGGKCADLNALYIGLAMAAGLPARDVYGIRVAPSRFGYRSLGAGSAAITTAQHCRAEVYLAGFGWVPVDPADVRKVVLEEPPANLALDDPRVVAARATLFGAWETNWLAYNFAHDVVLPGSRGPKVGFLMYPQAEVAGLRRDCLDPDGFKYAITSRELTGA